MSVRRLVVVVSLLVAFGCATGSGGGAPGANALDFPGGYPSPETSAALRDELLYTRAVQAYLWALPVLNWYGMKEASEAEFGAGYHVLPIWKSRLDARTKVTTPNSDVIYAMGYLDLKQDGPLVIEAPPGLQGILDDAFQRPICSEGKIAGKLWCGDVGLPGPDKGKGGKYLLLPPGWKGSVPGGYLPFRSRTYGVFVFWRAFFEDPKQLAGPVAVMEKTRIYPLGKKAGAKKMEFPDASGIPIDMLPPRDARAFDMLKRWVDAEYVDPRDMDMRGLLAGIGIKKDAPFEPDPHAREILDRAARRASEMGRYLATEGIGARPGARVYEDRQWMIGFPPDPGRADLASPTDTGSDRHTFRDSEGRFLSGDRSYRMTLPPNIPAKLFWSVTVYDVSNSSGLDNGQPFPSLNSMDRPTPNDDGSIDVEFGPQSPGAGRNWLATVPGKGFFVILRLYGPTKAFYDQSWKPGDLEPAL